MIAMYEPECCIAIGDAVSMDPVTDPRACAELRLEVVAPPSRRQLSSAQDFSAVIGQQVLAQLAG
jgi:ribosome maturation factor RimP